MRILNSLSYQIINSAYKVHTELGPGLLESSYEICLQHLLIQKGFRVERQKALPIVFDGIKLDNGYRLDLVVNNMIIVEIKSVDAICPIHKAQILTYLKLSGYKLGLLINFNVSSLKNGINRFIY